MEPALHGGALEAVRLAHPEVKEPWIDLSTGINPVAYPVAEFELSVWSGLPQQEHLGALLAGAASRYGAPGPDHVVAAAGTQAIIQALPRLFARNRVVIVGPTYEEHARAWARGRCEVTIAANVEEALRARPNVLVVVNPNNPTGQVYSGEELLSVARELGAHDGLLVVDEAFCDLLEDGTSLIPMLPDNAIVMRSFGKTYGLAGLRLGFGVCSVSLAAKLRAELGPWAVSGPGIEIGRRALGDTGWLEATRLRLVGESGRLRDLLESSGFSIVGYTPLFVLGSIEGADTVRDRLARAGIHVRHFPQLPTWLRLGIPGDETQWHRLSVALTGGAMSGKSPP